MPSQDSHKLTDSSDNPTVFVMSHTPNPSQVDRTAKHPAPAPAPAPKQGPKRAPQDERSPNTNSQPIPIPRQTPHSKLPTGWKPAPARVHHSADNITDYCLSGSHGWQTAQAERVAQSEKGVGRITEGAWPAKEKIVKQEVVRKDVVGIGDEDGGGEEKREGELDSGYQSDETDDSWFYDED